MKIGKQFALVSLVLAAAVPAFAQFRSGNVSPSLQLLSIPEVRKELKLTDAQSTELNEVQRGIRGSAMAMFRSLKETPATERRKKFEAFRSDLDRKLVVLLDAGQRKRLRELELQRDGPRVLLKPDVGAELRLTPEQQGKLSAASRAESAEIRALYQGATKQLTPEEQEDARNKIKLIQTKTNSAIYEVLTTDQRSRLRVMQGQPFKFPERKAPAVTVTTPGQAKPTPAPKPATKPVGKK